MLGEHRYQKDKADGVIVPLLNPLNQPPFHSRPLLLASCISFSCSSSNSSSGTNWVRYRMHSSRFGIQYHIYTHHPVLIITVSTVLRCSGLALEWSEEYPGSIAKLLEVHTGCSGIVLCPIPFVYSVPCPSRLFLFLLLAHVLLHLSSDNERPAFYWLACIRL